jgi:hypothetical protein
MSGAVLSVCTLEACDAAGIPAELGHALIWRTPPRGSAVTPTQWRGAREVFAAELVQQGWSRDGVADLLGETPTWVFVACTLHADRFVQAESPSVDN